MSWAWSSGLYKEDNEALPGCSLCEQNPEVCDPSVFEALKKLKTLTEVTVSKLKQKRGKPQKTLKILVNMC